MYMFSSPVKGGEMNTFQKGTLTEDRLGGTLSGTLSVPVPQLSGHVWGFPHHRNGGFLLDLGET